MVEYTLVEFLPVMKAVQPERGKYIHERKATNQQQATRKKKTSGGKETIKLATSLKYQVILFPQGGQSRGGVPRLRRPCSCYHLPYLCWRRRCLEQMASRFRYPDFRIGLQISRFQVCRAMAKYFEFGPVGSVLIRLSFFLFSPISMTVMSFLVLILSWGSMGLETAAAVVSKQQWG